MTIKKGKFSPFTVLLNHQWQGGKNYSQFMKSLFNKV